MIIGTLATTEKLKERDPLRTPNPFYARSMSKYGRIDRHVDAPASIFDYLVYGITNFKLECLFNSAESTTAWYTRQGDPTPDELQIHECITSGIEACTGATATKGFSSNKDTGEGKPDAVWGNVVIEFVLSNNDVAGHFNRFDLCPAYHQDNQLLIVFSTPEAEVRLPTQRSKKTAFPPANIAIVRFHKSTVWAVQLELCVATEQPKPSTGAGTLQEGKQPQGTADDPSLQYTHELTWTSFEGPEVPVDFVARHVILDESNKSFKFTSAQTVTIRNADSDAAIFVNVRFPDGTCDSTDVSQTLRDSNFPFTVDGLKDAVMKEYERDPLFKDKSRRHLKVYPAGAKKGDTAYEKMSTSLCSASLKEPYWVELK
jgi:hypothetical protein